MSGIGSHKVKIGGMTGRDEGHEARRFAGPDEKRHNGVVKIDALSDGTADYRTREAVARLLLERGPQTAVTLSNLLELSPVGVRRHLDALIGEGLVTTHTRKPLGQRGRGRPAKVFALTEAGR